MIQNYYSRISNYSTWGNPIYSIDILAGNISATEKIPTLWYMSASSGRPPSVRSGLRMSVQPAKSALTIVHLSEQ